MYRAEESDLQRYKRCFVFGQLNSRSDRSSIRFRPRYTMGGVVEGIKSCTLYLSINKDNATNSSIAESSINNRMDRSRSHGYVPAPHCSLFLTTRPSHGS